MVDIEIIDHKINEGYEYLLKQETVKACDVWLDAWEGIKTIFIDNNINEIDELNKIFKWGQFPSNYVQDLEAELHNAGLENPEYNRKRISYCNDLLTYISKDELMKGNTRCAIAEAYFELGNSDECDRLYSQWLEEDPQWGWGYIGWYHCYQYNRRSRQDITKAKSILERALSIQDVRDRIDLLDTALGFYDENGGDDAKITGLRDEFSKLKTADPSRLTMHKPIPATTEKIGRNDPCPCGSGKKYKKCHGMC